jgi:hypothetical protein
VAATAYQPTQRGGSNVPQDLLELVKKGKDARSKFEKDWYLNLAFYKGDQWSWWNYGRIERPDPRTLPPNKVLLVDNRINGIVRTEVAKMTKQRPVPVGTPINGDEANINAAKLAERSSRSCGCPSSWGCIASSCRRAFTGRASAPPGSGRCT